MSWIRSLFSWIANYFRSGQAAKDAELAMQYASKALPFVKIAADIVVGLTPTQIDDLAWAALKAKYPSLFDDTAKNPDELKLIAFAVASDLLKQKYPELSTSVARAATQLGYIIYKNEQKPAAA